MQSPLCALTALFTNSDKCKGKNDTKYVKSAQHRQVCEGEKTDMADRPDTATKLVKEDGAKTDELGNAKRQEQHGTN